MVMTEPAAVIRDNLHELSEMQIEMLARHTPLTSSDLREYLQRSAQIKQLCLSLDAMRADFTPVLRPTRKGRRPRFQLGAI
jgi:hypothetical protein